MLKISVLQKGEHVVKRGRQGLKEEAGLPGG